MGPKRLHKAREANTAAGFGDRVWGHDRGFVVLSIWARSPCHVSCGQHNSLESSMPHTCSTRATHVQHDHFTCKFTIKMPFWQLSAPQGHFKRKGEHFAPLRENQRNLQQKCSCCTSCCTHVCCTLVACVFSGISFAASKVLGWQHVFGAWCGTFVAGARFWVASTTLSSSKGRRGKFWKASAMCILCLCENPVTVPWFARSKPFCQCDGRSQGPSTIRVAPPLWN